MSDDISHIIDHEFNIDGPFSYFNLDSFSGIGKKIDNDVDISALNLEKYWSEINNYIPYSIEKSSEAQGHFIKKNETIFIIKENDELNLIPKEVLFEQNPYMIIDYFIKGISA